MLEGAGAIPPFSCQPLTGHTTGTILSPMNTSATPTPTRAALIHAPASAVEPYLPINYSVAEEDPSTDTCVIHGVDSCGWTLDGYVLPRLASGLIFGEEIL